MNNIKGNRYIYHYHVFENVVENSDNYDLSKIMEVLPVVAFGKFKRKNEMNFGKITENHQLFKKQKFYKEILRFCCKVKNYIIYIQKNETLIKLNGTTSY